MTGPVPTPGPRSTKRRRPWLAGLLTGIQVLLVGASVGVLMVMAALYLHRAMQRKPPPVPPTMEAVDWHDPHASIYCVACHRQVAPAMAGLDVRRGHSQNVRLNALQIQAVREMGTIAGPGETLICMSCHRLDSRAGAYMLADTRQDSRLCQRCHPGHYAQGTPHDLRLSAPDSTNRLGETVAQAGPCSACHLAHRFAREIIPSPLDPDGYCITCHRSYGLAEARARTTMEHPESHCLACHNPHDDSFGSFLRYPTTELCRTCHSEIGLDAAAGSHPLGPMDRPMPAEFITPDTPPQLRDQITCNTCHAVHEAPSRPLLRLPVEDNALCLACHRDELAARTLHGDVPRHGQLPLLSADQREVVLRSGGRVGPAGELLCVSCHNVHHAAADTSLLATRPMYADACTACHPHAAGVAGTPHDLRTNFPYERNAAGRTAGQAGVCSPCHQAHGFARPRFVAAADPDGQCLSCHRQGAYAQNRLPGAIDHPQTACGECHNPHDPRHGPFLIEPAQTLCQGCHADHARLIGGPHDPAAMHSERWPALAASADGPCLPCHVPHGGERADLFRVGAGEPVGNHDDVCLYCHPDAAWRADSDSAAIHPRHIASEHSHVDLALVPTDEAGNKRMGCRTCHDPHGPAEPPHLARIQPQERTEDLCLRCHADKRYIRLTGHAPQRLEQAGFQTDSCKPCHAMHARPDDTWGQVLSPRFLLTSTADVQHGVEARLPCLACHHPDGPAPVRRYIAHPPVLMANTARSGDPGYLPLFNPDGREDPQGQIVCRTCHLSHGRLDLLKLAAEKPNLSPEEQEALRAQVRPFIAPNLCTACHGAQARAKFLHFHDATLRRHEPGGEQAAGRRGP